MSTPSSSNLNNVAETQSSQSDNYHNFNKWFLLTIAISILLVVSFNAVIDPYGIYKTPNFLGINHEKPQKQFNERLFKTIDIIRIKPRSIFLGSSRTKQGLDPEHPALSNLRPTYNLAVDGANPYEMLRYLQHTIRNQPDLQEVILGIDFFMFNESLHNQPGFDENRLEKKYLTLNDLMNSLFSIDTFTISKDTVLASLKKSNKDESYGENGFFPHRKYKDGNNKGRFTHSINIYFKYHHEYDFSQKHFEDFQKIVNLCREKKIKVIVFMSPAHATQWEAIRAAGEWDVFENWKRKVVKVTPVWDFATYNTITTERLNDVMENYSDNSHYTKPAGDLLLNRILAYKEKEVPSDFGVLVTQENIESHLAKIRSDREEWVKIHPSELELVQSLEKKFMEDQNKNNKH